MLDRLLDREISTRGQALCEQVAVEPDPDGSPCPERDRAHVLVDVIHDGNHLPEEFLHDEQGRALLSDELLPRRFVEERDWGAELVAACLASALHLGDYFRVNVARALLDFGRFPGITPPAADHMHRHAINTPFSQVLSHAQKARLLEVCYDGLSTAFDAVISDKRLKIAIHTYDEHNPTASRRPAVSLLTRSYGHQHGHPSPLQVFDPLFPAELAEFTADPILRSRIALALEEAAIHTADNYPYSLPDGSVEVRAQVWYFFQHLRRHYESFYPVTRYGTPEGPTPRDRVWDMLLDTNLRSARSDSLRGYLHLFRRPPTGQEAHFLRARGEYERVCAHLAEHRDEIVTRYRNALDRPNSILVEVRKDLVWHFEGGRPIGPRLEDARLIGRTLATAIQTYLTRDRAARQRALVERDPRFQ